MCRLLETICVKEGKFLHVNWHNRRFNRSRMQLLGCSKQILLENEIHMPVLDNQVIYKCRIVYSREIETLEFIPYLQRNIVTLKLVHDDNIQYQFKYFDRSYFNILLQECGRYDDILIVKNGLITDTSFSNIVFFDGHRWITPSKPLLKGTCRERLLAEGRISEKTISTTDLIHFQEARLINAMNDLDESLSIRIEDIYF